MALLLVLTTGCGKPAPPPNAQLEIEDVAKWYSKFRADHRGKPPSDEAEFVSFVDGMLTSRGRAPLEVEKFLTSPRDHQRWVVQYKKPTAKDPQANIAVREQTGFDGKKLIAFEVGHSCEVDEAKLEELLAVE